MGKSGDASGLSATLPGIAAALGVLLLAAGLVLPAMSDPARALSSEQAEEYYEASSAVEHAAADQARRNRTKEAPSSADQARELRAARDRFAAAKQQIDDAKRGSKSVALWLKISGGALVLLGAGGLLAQKSGR